MRRRLLAATLAVGVASAVLAQEPSAPAGLTVVLVLDATASVSTLPIPIDQRFAQVFNAFLQGLRPSDRGCVAVLTSHVHFGPITADHRELSASARVLLQIAETDRLGPSPIWDAIDEALGLAGADPSGRPAVVLFSDGKSSGNVHGLDEVIGHAQRLHATISAVVEGPGSVFLARSPQVLDPADLIDRLTSATGGRRLLDRPGDPRQRNPGPMVTLLMDALHSREPGPSHLGSFSRRVFLTQLGSPT